jgi:hypothetical protein
MARKIDHGKAKRRDAARKQRAERPGAVVAWWLTPAVFAAPCSSCGESMGKGSTVAYNHAEKRAVCRACVARLGLSVQPSRKLVAKRAGSRGNQKKRRPAG